MYLNSLTLKKSAYLKIQNSTYFKQFAQLTFARKLTPKLFDILE